MLGWWINIYQKHENGQTTPFADWECGLGGTDWLDEMCRSKQAVQTQNNGGYPDLYEVPARYIRKLLLEKNATQQNSDIPVFMETDDGETVLMQHYGYRPLKLENTEILHNLPPETILNVQVFDLS